MVRVVGMGPVIFKFRVQNCRLRVPDAFLIPAKCVRVPNLQCLVARDKFLLMVKHNSNVNEVKIGVPLHMFDVCVFLLVRIFKFGKSNVITMFGVYK